MTAATLNFEENQAGACECGATFNRKYSWTDGTGAAIDLTNWTAKMQVRKVPNDLLIIELSTTNSRLILGGINGTIQFLINATDTSTLEPGTYSYDLKMTNGGDGTVIRLLEGIFVVTSEITV